MSARPRRFSRQRLRAPEAGSSRRRGPDFRRSRDTAGTALDHALAFAQRPPEGFHEFVFLQVQGAPAQALPGHCARVGRRHTCVLHAVQPPSCRCLAPAAHKGGQRPQWRASNFIRNVGLFSDLASTVGYALVNREDSSMAFVFMCNAIGCSTILLVAAWKRGRQRPPRGVGASPDYGRRQICRAPTCRRHDE